MKAKVLVFLVITWPTLLAATATIITGLVIDLSDVGRHGWLLAGLALAWSAWCDFDAWANKAVVDELVRRLTAATQKLHDAGICDCKGEPDE